MRLTIATLMLGAGAGAAALVAGCSGAERGGGAACDRACLEGFLDLYLEALVAGDPTRLPLADDAVFVENNQTLEIGQGTWRTVTGLGRYRHYFADAAAAQAAVIAVVEENGTDIIYDLRLAIADREIAEIEALAIRDPAGAARYEERGAPHPKFLETVPAERRLPRERLVAVADRYLSGMQRNDPYGDYSFFHDECDRWEHARRTTNNDPEEYGHSTDTVFVTLGCRAQFETGFLGFVTRIRDRRYVVVDEERQTVFGFAMLDHDGTVRSIPLASGEDFVVPPYFSSPRMLQAGEAWRIEEEKIRQIEMTLTELPYGMRPAFPTGDAWLSDPPGLELAVQGGILCDRLCLESFLGAFLTALIRKDPSVLPGADTLTYFENRQRLEVGDGLWGTVTGIGGYRIAASDPDSQTAVFVGTIVETDVTGLLFARVTLAGDRVGTIETFVVREERPGERGGTLTLFAPRLRDAFDPARFAAVDPSLTFMPPFQVASDPTALAQTAREYFAGLETAAAALRGRRTWVADVARGLVVDVAFLDVANDEAAFAGVDDAVPAQSSGPYSIMTAALHKVVDGVLVTTESAALPVPYGME